MRASELRGLRYDPVALNEYGAEVAYYRARGLGVAERFHEAVQAAVDRAFRLPEAFRLVDARTGVRAIRVKRFPFLLMYMVRDDVLVITAVAHTSRRTEHYLSRS